MSLLNFYKRERSFAKNLIINHQIQETHPPLFQISIGEHHPLHLIRVLYINFIGFLIFKILKFLLFQFYQLFYYLLLDLIFRFNLIQVFLKVIH